VSIVVDGNAIISYIAIVISTSLTIASIVFIGTKVCLAIVIIVFLLASTKEFQIVIIAKCGWMGEAFMVCSTAVGFRIPRNFLICIGRESIPQITWVAKEKAFTLKYIAPKSEHLGYLLRSGLRVLYGGVGATTLDIFGGVNKDSSCWA
jgi:hypothetical protein